MTVFPVAYAGSVPYFARLLAAADPVIDTGEHYVKQSGRSRCRILGANGPLTLTVQVVSGNTPRVPVRWVRIDYSRRWQHQHWRALESAYRSAPYFDHYAPRIEPFFRRRYDYLVDLDLEMTFALAELLDGTGRVRVSERYIEPEEADEDLRGLFSAKVGRDQPDEGFVPQPYWQVFSDRTPFVAGLSVLDLLFCEGPEAKNVLRSCLISG